MKYFFVILILLGIVHTAYSNDSSVDSLKNLLSKKSESDTSRVILLNQIAAESFSHNYDSGYVYASKACELSKTLEFKAGLITGLRLKGLYHYYTANYDQAIQDYMESIEVAEKENDNQGASKGYNNLALVYQMKDDHTSAIENFQNALELYEKQNDQQGISKCLNNMGISFWSQGNYVLALQNYLEALKYFEKIDNKLGMAYTLNNVGIIHSEQGKNNSAMEYYNKALAIKEEINDQVGIAGTLNDIGLIYQDEQDHDKAIEQFQEAQKIFEKFGNKIGIADILTNLGMTYLLKGNLNISRDHTRQALEIYEEIDNKSGAAETNLNLGRIYSAQKDFNSALKFTKKCLEISRKHNILELERDAFRQLSEIYSSSGDFKGAFESFVQYELLDDSLFNKENISQMAGLELQYKFDKEKLAMQIQQNSSDVLKAEELKRHKIIRDFLIAGILLMIILVTLVSRNFINKRKSNQILEEQKKIIEEDNKILKELNDTKNRFFSIIAHDLRGPLGSLHNLGELLSKSHGNIEPKEQQQLLELLTKEAKGTFNLLDNLLNWAASNSGTITFQPEYIVMDKIVEENLSIFGTMAKDKKITLFNEIEPGIKAYADFNMVNTIVRNLISNAIKFTENGGEIKIISQNGSDNTIQIGISDNGIGVAPEIIPTLFNLDAKHSTPGTVDEKGSGLGLKLCKEFVEKNNGTISVESKLGEGSLFYFTLPASSI